MVLLKTFAVMSLCLLTLSFHSVPLFYLKRDFRVMGILELEEIHEIAFFLCFFSFEQENMLSYGNEPDA